MDQPIHRRRPTITPRDIASVFAIGWLTPYALTIPFYYAIIILRNAAGGYGAGFDQILWGDSNQVGLTGVDYLWIAFILACELFAVFFFVILPQRMTWRSFGLHRASNKWLYVAVLAIGLLALIDEALLYYLKLTPEADAFLKSSLLPANPTITDLLVAILVAGFAASFIEELVFRGVMYRGLRTLLGIWPAAISSAALFSAVHMYFINPGGQYGWWMSGQIFVFGLIAAILLEKSGSLWPSIVMHTVANTGFVAFEFWVL